MENHKLNYEKLNVDFACRYHQLSYTANDRHFKNKTSISENVVDLLKEDLNIIEQYFYDLFMSVEDEFFVGDSFYAFYHRYFSYEISDKIEEEIKNGTSSMEEALIIYGEEGYKIVPFRELSEDMKLVERKSYTWNKDDTYPIIINKDLTRELSGSIFSLEKLDSLKFYNSKEDYIGEVLRRNLDVNIIKEKKEEARDYYLECFRNLSNNNGLNWEEEINVVLSMPQPKVYSVEKH